MPLCSAFTPCGQLECSSRPSIAENVYRSMVANLGGQYDLTVGGHEEATLYARARSIARAMQAQRRAANNALPMKCLELLPLQEAGYGIVPGETDTIVQRQTALAARMLLSRGATQENIEAQLRAILGSAFLGYRTVAPYERSTWPASPGAGPGVFPRADAAIVPKFVRTIDPVVATGLLTADSYSETNQDADAALQDAIGVDLSAIGQTFLGNGGALSTVRWYVKKTGTPTGSAVAKIYAHSGAYGGGVPTGPALATSDLFDVTSLTGSHVLRDFVFSGANQVLLASGTPYVAVLEYSAGSGGNIVQAGIDLSASTHPGNFVQYAAGAWSATTTLDACFYVLTFTRVTYQALDPSQGSVTLVAGDVMTLQLEVPGVAERVTVATAGADALGTYFTATFARAHDSGATGVVGAVPVTTSSQRSSLIVATAAAALDPPSVGKVADLMGRIARAVSTWAVVQPTSPGASTLGPFTLGLSPLGCVPIGSLKVVAPGTLRISSVTPSSVPAAGGTPITIGGSGFTYASAVAISGLALGSGFVVVNDNTITCVTDAHAAGVVPVTVDDGVTPTATGSITFV